MQPLRQSREQDMHASIVSLRRVKRIQASHRHFGALLREVRQDADIDQQAITTAFDLSSSEQALKKLGVSWPARLGEIKVLSEKQYGRIERNEKPPWFSQLLPLYLAMAACGITMSPEERREFIELARQKIETKVGQYREELSEEDWLWLEEQILKAEGDPKSITWRGQIHLLETREEYERLLEEQQAQSKLQRAKLLADLAADTSHIIGREAWLDQMLSHVGQQASSRKKVVIIQAMMGVGKTSGLKLLQKRLLEDADHYHVIFHEFKLGNEIEAPASPAEKTPAEYLDLFLARILNELQPELAERYEAPPLKKQVSLILDALRKQSIPLVVLADDAQVLLEENGELFAGWQYFLNELIEHDRPVILFVATREWPGWTERKDSYILQTEMEVLSLESCVQIWKNLGFAHEQESILRKATDLCASNPRMIEIVAQHISKPIYSFSWTLWQKERDGELQSLRRFVDDPHYLSSSLIDAFPLLEEITSTRLSADAKQLLMLLAISPLPLPAPLLAYLVQYPKRCIKELTRTSLLARDPERLYLLPLVAESILQQVASEERVSSEDLLIGAYQHWTQEGSYLDEQEQASVIAELAVLYLKHSQLLEAAELVLNHGWLLYAFKHAQHIARVTDGSIRSLQDYSVENETGGMLLQLRLLRFFKNDWADTQVKQAYSHLYAMLHHSQIPFKPRAALYIIHHRLLYLIEQGYYSEAYLLINEEYEDHAGLNRNDPVTLIELLDHRAFVAGRWGDYMEEALGEHERAFQLRQEAVDIHLQCVEQLRRYEQLAAPLLRSHILYQRARILHDLSFYERCIGDEKAMAHIEECLLLKEAGYATKGSLAITYDDYAHLLAKQGQYRRAEHYSALAIQLTQERMVDANLKAGPSQLGMLLINRGKLLLQLKRFDEARDLFQRGKGLVEGTTRHTLSFPAAEKGLRSIEEQRRGNPRGYLDYQWFARYQALTSYSDVRWLTPAGRFIFEEEQEWTRLKGEKNEQVNNGLSEIVVRSQERELAASFDEQREPHFIYPFIPLDEIAEKEAGLIRLRAEIEQQEENPVVRRLYLDAIDERLNELGMISATGRQDNEAFRMYSQRLYPLPTPQEMEQAIRPLARQLRKGLQNSATSDLARRIIGQTRSWSIDPMSLEEEEEEPGQTSEEQLEPGSKARHYVSSEAAKRFFEEVFNRYQFAWTIVQDPAASFPRVSLTDKKLVLPEGKQISTARIRGILAHEIEMHVFRSVAGERSRLLLLSLGLANFLETEEGLATYYSQQAAQFGSTQPNKNWMGTLTTGLAAGVISQPYSFHFLRSFLIQVFVLRDLLSPNKKTKEEIQADALKNAQKSCLRRWRGVPNLAQVGICATKDVVYLRGYLSVCNALQKNPEYFERLLVGSVGLLHLEALSELGITKSHVVHQQLACNPDLETYITQYTQEMR